MMHRQGRPGEVGGVQGNEMRNGVDFGAGMGERVVQIWPAKRHGRVEHTTMNGGNVECGAQPAKLIARLSLTERAGQALYRAKLEERNRVCA